MMSRRSVYQTQATIPSKQILQAATVEFWFKTAYPMNETTFLFQLLTNKTNEEFLAIYFDASYYSALICAPIGRDLIVAPFIVYTDFTDNPMIYKYWIHLSCSFDQFNINSTLFQHDSTIQNEWFYSANRSLPIRVTE